MLFETLKSPNGAVMNFDANKSIHWKLLSHWLTMIPSPRKILHWHQNQNHNYHRVYEVVDDQGFSRNWWQVLRLDPRLVKWDFLE